MSRRRYHAVSWKKLRPRLEAAEFEERIDDPRGNRGRQIRWGALTQLLAIGMAVRKTSHRQLARHSGKLHKNVRRYLRLRRRRISATKVRDTIQAIDWRAVREANIAGVKEEQRRGHLDPADKPKGIRGPGEKVSLPFGVAAIDGKAGATIEDEDAFEHRYVQRVEPEEDDERGDPYGLIRFHRTCLVSSPATVCLDQRPIPGETNEIGALEETLEQLFEAYNPTGIFEMIVADAGNCSEARARQIDEADYWYGLRLKKNVGEIHREAIRRLGGEDDGKWEFRSTEKLAPGEPDGVYRDRSDGKDVLYRLWTSDLSETGSMNWNHARTLVRLQRIDQTGEGDPRVGNRYVVFNLPADRLTSRQWIRLVRMYWRCENNNHWTADVIWREDADEPTWATDPEGVIVTSFFRMFGLNVVSVLRTMTRRAIQPIHPPWEEAIEDLIFSLRIGQHPNRVACR